MGDVIEVLDQKGVIMVYRVDKIHEDSLVATNMHGRGLLLQPFSFFDRFARGKGPELVKTLKEIALDFQDMEIPIILQLGEKHEKILQMFKEGIEACFYGSISNPTKLYDALINITGFRNEMFHIRYGAEIAKVRAQVREGTQLAKVSIRDKVLEEHEANLELINKAFRLISETHIKSLKLN